MWKKLILSLFLVLFLSVYGNAESADSSKVETLTIKAKIIEFLPGSYDVNFGDLGGSVYDTTVFEVIEPTELEGKKLSIYHDHPRDSIWAQKDALVEFEILRDALNEYGPEMFSGVVISELKSLTNQSTGTNLQISETP